MSLKNCPKKVWIIPCALLLAVVLVLAGLYVSSLPESFAKSFYAVEVTADGTVLEECDLSLTFTKQNHLFEEDYYHGVSLDVAGLHFDDTRNTDVIYPYSLWNQPHDWFMLNCYHANTNSFGNIVKICCSNDRDWCFVKVKLAGKKECQYFIGSVDEDVDYQAVLEICGDLIE